MEKDLTEFAQLLNFVQDEASMEEQKNPQKSTKLPKPDLSPGTKEKLNEMIQEMKDEYGGSVDTDSMDEFANYSNPDPIIFNTNSISNEANYGGYDQPQQLTFPMSFEYEFDEEIEPRFLPFDHEERLREALGYNNIKTNQQYPNQPNFYLMPQMQMQWTMQGQEAAAAASKGVNVEASEFPDYSQTPKLNGKPYKPIPSSSLKLGFGKSVRFADDEDTNFGSASNFFMSDEEFVTMSTEDFCAGFDTDITSFTPAILKLKAKRDKLESGQSKNSAEVTTTTIDINEGLVSDESESECECEGTDDDGFLNYFKLTKESNLTVKKSSTPTTKSLSALNSVGNMSELMKGSKILMEQKPEVSVDLINSLSPPPGSNQHQNQNNLVNVVESNHGSLITTLEEKTENSTIQYKQQIKPTQIPLSDFSLSPSPTINSLTENNRDNAKMANTTPLNTNAARAFKTFEQVQQDYETKKKSKKYSCWNIFGKTRGNLVNWKNKAPSSSNSNPLTSLNPDETSDTEP